MKNKEDLSEVADNVKIKEDFLEFLLLLIDDLDKNKNKDEWENPTLERYLDALYGFTSSIEGYYKNNNQEVNVSIPTWNMFARMLHAAKIYE